MLELSAPFYGKIRRLSVNPIDNALWVLTAHPNERSIAPTRIDIQGVLDGVNTLDATHSVDVEGVATDVLGHHTGLYLLTNDGKVHRLTTAGDAFEEVFDCGGDFGLQGIIDFGDGLAEYPQMEPDGAIAMVGATNRKLVLIGETSAHVVDIAADGSFSIGKTLEPSVSGGQITSWAAHTVFGAEGTQTHHCAFGWDSGSVTAYFTDDDSNAFAALGLMHASEVEVSADNPLHEGAVSALVYVQDIDAKGRHKRFLISTGIDMKIFQTSLLEGISIPRKNQHAGRITNVVLGGFSDGDGAYRGPKFGRFYTLSTDGTVKAWLNEYTNEQTSTVPITASIGIQMVLSKQHTAGAYSKGKYMGTRLPTPHLVLSNDETLTVVALETIDKKDVRQLSDLRQNGRIAESADMRLDGGEAFVSEMGWHDDANIRMASLARFGNWDAEWLMDRLSELASENSYPIAYREAAMNALRNSTHPRRIVLLESMVEKWGNTDATQKMAYDVLKGIFAESLRAQRLVLENSGAETKLYVIGDLADIALNKGPLQRDALQMLQGLVANRDYDLALRAYDHICGEGDLTPVMSGVEGVLYGIHSSRTDIRREMAVRLANRGLMDAFETTLILRRLLEDGDESIRERAIDVSLLRAPNVANVLRFGDAGLHARLYVLVNGPFASTDDQEALLKSALPTSEDVERLRQLFTKEDASVQADLDVLIEFSMCTKDDVAVYALQARASFGFEAAAQGLLKLSNSSNEKVMRQALVGLGYMVHLDDAHDRICGVTLSKSTPFEIGCVSIYHAIKGFELRDEDPVNNVLRKVLDGGHPKLRETAVVIAQQRLNQLMPSLKDGRGETVGASTTSSAPAEAVELSADKAEELQQVEKELQDTVEMLELGKSTKNTTIVNVALATLNSLKALKASILGGKITEEPAESVDVVSSTGGFEALRRLLKDALCEETLHENVRSEVYKSFWMHNLEDASFSSDKSDTFTLFLNLRDRTLFNQALKDLCAHIADPADRKWALSVFEQLVNQDIIPDHHSNVWDIWTVVANFAETEMFEQDVLRIGFNCSAPCHCKIHNDGSYTVCDRHRIRRNAFLRVLSASGDWLAAFIREALENTGKRNSSAGESAAILAVSNKAKEAVAKMDDPSAFILSMLNGTKAAQQEFACELLLMYPRFYSTSIQKVFYKMRKESLIVNTLSLPEGAHLMTEDLFEYFFKQVLKGKTEFLFVGLERFALAEGRAEEFAKALYKQGVQGDVRLVRKALTLATNHVDDWGEAMIDAALASDDATAKIAFSMTLRRLQREAAKLNNQTSLKAFVTGFYAESSVTRQIWVVETLKLNDASKWELELLKDICSSKVSDIREKGYILLNGLQQTTSWETWMVELLKQGMMDSSSTIADLCFQGLLAINKLLGPDEERAFLSKVAREDKRNQERAVAMALKTTAAWRIPFILDALNDEDAHIRSMMCQKVQGISGLSDQFFQDLMTHKYEEVREMSTQVLAARGLYRPKLTVSGSVKDIILRDPPRRPEYGDFKNSKGEVDWSRFSSARIIWYQKVRAWKDAKIDAIIAAGKTHETAYFDVFKRVLSKLGYSKSVNALWSTAVYATSWYADDWKEFVILHSGWVLQDTKDLKYASKEADSQRDDRMRVAWNVACTRAGCKDNLQWLVQQYNDRGWNYFREYIKKEYLFEGLFAVDSSIGWDSKSEGPGFTIMQRMMNDKREFVNDIFRLNMLRLSQQGGPVDFIAIGYTSSDAQTVLESVQMRELQYSKDALFKGVVEKLNDTVVPKQDPYALSNVGGNWYHVVRLTLSLHSTTADITPEVANVHWQNVAKMLSCHHPQLRARAVNAYFRRHVYGEEKDRFITDIENFSRQLLNTTADSFPLFQDGKRTSKDHAIDLAYDGYMGLIRKTDFDQTFRGDAITYIATMCERASEVEKAIPVLRSALSMGAEKIRFQAYRMLIALQDASPDVMSLNQLTQMGLRSTDERLKRMAISLIWSTTQLSQQDKLHQLESILKNANDVAARYAFDVLYAFAGRPSAWDQADSDKEKALTVAKQEQAQKLEALKAQISEIRAVFDQYRDDVNGQLYEIQDVQVRSTLQQALKDRRATMNAEVDGLRQDIQNVEEAYRQAVEQIEVAHTASMKAPLSAADQETWAKACARRDELLEMGIDAYHSKLRVYAVDSGLTELARRRPYFENDAEEFTGYYLRLLSVLDSALQSPYDELVRHTALNMAQKKFPHGYLTLLKLLASHDGTDQEDAIAALVQLGPVALTQYKDENGNALPRTAIILLDRAVNDEFGTVEEWSIFNALGKLKDRHSSVRDRLFAYLDKGVDSEQYSSILEVLVDMTECQNQILEDTDWADLTPSDFEELQDYVEHELDWEQVDLAKFETLYQDVYGESLLAEIMNNLIDRGDYGNLTGWPDMISMAESTKGFDVLEADGERTEPINAVLRRLAALPNTSDVSYVRERAIDALTSRLYNIGRMRTVAQNSSFIAQALVEILDMNAAVIDDKILSIAICLADNKQGALSSTIFDVLYTVATTQTEPLNRRIKAMKALGSLGDERSVLALLNAAGLDAYGEELLVDPEIPALSSYDVQRLQNAASEGLGGMIFAQEREGIYQLLSKMSRSRDTNTRRKGFEGLRYFLRSDAHALNTAAVLVEKYQSAINANNSEVSFFAGLLATALTPLATESHPDNAGFVIMPETESTVKEYILSAFFRETFELDGEAFNPIPGREGVFECDYNNVSNMELVYQVVRQWIHGPHQSSAETVDGETTIDFSYLEHCTPEERTKALKAERKLFENYKGDGGNTKYTLDATKALATYLSPIELLDLAAYAQRVEISTNNPDRYNILFNAFMNARPSPISVALECVREGFTLDLKDELPEPYRGWLAVELFEHNPSALNEHMDAFVDLMQWLHTQLDTFVQKRRFGDTDDFMDQRLAYFDLLTTLLNIGRQLPTRSELVKILEGLLNVCHLMNGESWLHNSYEDLFETYLEYGQIDWDLVDRHLNDGARGLRMLVVSYLDANNATQVLPRILSWIEDDAAALSRLVDVLSNMPEALQQLVVAQLKDTGSSRAVLFVLTRLQSVDAFKTVVDSFRDDKGSISAEVGVRSATTPRSTESTSSPLLVETVFNSLAMVATDKAEYYLRDLSEDTSLDYSVRQAAAKAANVAYRRRVPLHIRRAERS